MKKLTVFILLGVVISVATLASYWCGKKICAMCTSCCASKEVQQQ